MLTLPRYSGFPALSTGDIQLSLYTRRLIKLHPDLHVITCLEVSGVLPGGGYPPAHVPGIASSVGNLAALDTPSHSGCMNRAVLLSSHLFFTHSHLSLLTKPHPTNNVIHSTLGNHRHRRHLDKVRTREYYPRTSTETDHLGPARGPQHA